MNPLSVKWDHQGAFRRFVVDVPANGDVYGALITKVVAVQPGFNDSLAWKDNEGDLIVFTSSTELAEAVRSLQPNEPLRLYTVVDKNGSGNVAAAKSAAASVSQPVENHGEQQRSISIETAAQKSAENGNINGQEEVQHLNVCCDECQQMPLVGVRHKCLVCLDYDLCDKCNTENKHPGHPMARITDPNDRSWMAHFAPYARRRHMGPPPCWMRHIPQHIQEQIKLQQQQQQQQEKPACPCNAGAEQSKQGESQPSSAADAFNADEFLREIGTFTAQLLSNFGIDVDVKVEEGQKKDKTNSEAKSAPEAADSSKKNDSPTKEEQIRAEFGKMMAQFMPVFKGADFGALLNAIQQQHKQQ